MWDRRISLTRDVVLGVIYVAMELDIMFPEIIAERKVVIDKKKRPQNRGPRNNRQRRYFVILRSADSLL